MIQTMDFNPVISAPNTTEVRKLLSCWSSSGGAEGIRGQGRESENQTKSCLSCHVPVAWHVWYLQQCSVCVCMRVCVSVRECVHMCVCTTALYQVELHQFHNCAMQGVALDFSGENAGVLALS